MSTTSWKKYFLDAKDLGHCSQEKNEFQTIEFSFELLSNSASVFVVVVIIVVTPVVIAVVVVTFIIDNTSWNQYFQDGNDLGHCSQGKQILDYRIFFWVILLGCKWLSIVHKKNKFLTVEYSFEYYILL